MPEPPLPLRVVQESMGFEGNPGNRWEGRGFAEKHRQALFVRPPLGHHAAPDGPAMSCEELQ